VQGAAVKKIKEINMILEGKRAGGITSMPGDGENG